MNSYKLRSHSFFFYRGCMASTKPRTWKEVVQLSKDGVGMSNSYAYAKTAVRIAEEASLNEMEILNLAMHLGMKIYPRRTLFPTHASLKSSRTIIAGLPADWKISLSDVFFSLKYYDPANPAEYIAVVPSLNGNLPDLVHSNNGWLCGCQLVLRSSSSPPSNISNEQSWEKSGRTI